MNQVFQGGVSVASTTGEAFANFPMPLDAGDTLDAIQVIITTEFGTLMNIGQATITVRAHNSPPVDATEAANAQVIPLPLLTLPLALDYTDATEAFYSLSVRIPTLFRASPETRFLSVALSCDIEFHAAVFLDIFREVVR